jgi:cytochrome b561
MFNEVKKYHPVMRVLHWVMAICILLALGFIFAVDEDPSPQRFQLIGWHKALGVTVLMLIAFRLIARLLWKTPEPVAQSKALMMLSKIVHVCFYVLMFTVPLVGWLYSNSKGYGVSYFGFFDMPILIDKSPEIADTLKEAHEIQGLALLFIFILHVLGVIYHVMKRDGTLKRMV